ncbi:4'-phosphopantetheinyl transferase superfamily protein [Candidatus Uhrbacteria bacterium]|nr:4'-phosphopantetheinyl transferase superfamily protein [Candidatus Uhrbacteria bacterium]
MKSAEFDFNNVSLGTDLEEVARFVDFKAESRLAKNIFTARELKFVSGRANRAQTLAARFAAKEAVRKSVKENLRFNRIEIGSHPDGSPSVRYLDKKINKKYKTIISLSHTKEYAQAFCLTLKKYV